MSEQNIYPAAEEYSAPPDMSLSETLILENELGSIHGLLVKIWSVLGQNKDFISRAHSRAGITGDLLELAKMADYAAAMLRMQAGQFSRPGAELNRAAVQRAAEVKLYALSAAPAALNPAVPSIIYNDKITSIVNGRVVDRANGEWYVAFYGPRTEVKE